MINGLEGVPGSGKSYEAVVYHVLEALKKGRLVITNLPLNVEMFAAMDPSYRYLIELRTRPSPIRGTWDADRVDEKGNGNAFELFQVGQPTKVYGLEGVVTEAGTSLTMKAPSSVSTFGHVWDYYTTWKHPESGMGPLFVIDECHNALPVAPVTDPQVVEWFKLHRHYNVDVLLMTQSFRDMCQPIARLMGVLVKVRKADILGKADHYIRKVHSGYRGAVISTEQRKYLPQMFPLYKSHTQGNGVAEQAAGDVSPFIVKFKRFTWGFWVIALAVCVWAFWPQGKPVKVDRNAPLGPEMSERVNRAVKAYPGPVRGEVQEGDKKPVALDPEAVPEPYASKGLHVTGRLTMGKRTLYHFAVSSGGVRIADVTSEDLTRAGYVWEPLTDCAGTLRWKGAGKAITCDAPAIPQGSKQDPIVVALPKGSVIPPSEAATAPGMVSM